MMLLVPSKVDCGIILIEALQLETWLDGSGTLMTITQSGGIPKFLGQGVRAAIKEIEDLRHLRALHVMINRQPAGVTLPKHRDYLKPTPLQKGSDIRIERWHLPVQTNEDVSWWDESEGSFHMAPGYWYGPICFWKKHSVANLGTQERVHLIVDLDCHVEVQSG